MIGYEDYYVSESTLFGLVPRDRLTTHYTDEEHEAFFGAKMQPSITIDGLPLFRDTLLPELIKKGDLIFRVMRVRKTREDMSSYVSYGGIVRANEDGSEIGDVIESHYIYINPAAQKQELSGPAFFIRERHVKE